MSKITTKHLFLAVILFAAPALWWWLGLAGDTSLITTTTTQWAATQGDGESGVDGGVPEGGIGVNAEGRDAEEEKETPPRLPPSPAKEGAGASGVDGGVPKGDAGVKAQGGGAEDGKKTSPSPSPSAANQGAGASGVDGGVPKGDAGVKGQGGGAEAEEKAPPGPPPSQPHPCQEIRERGHAMTAEELLGRALDRDSACRKFVERRARAHGCSLGTPTLRDGDEYNELDERTNVYRPACSWPPPGLLAWLQSDEGERTPPSRQPWWTDVKATLCAVECDEGEAAAAAAAAGGGTCRVRIEARRPDGSAVRSGGDDFRVRLVGPTIESARDAVVDFCNGTYVASVRLPPIPGSYAVDVRLVSRAGASFQYLRTLNMWVYGRDTNDTVDTESQNYGGQIPSLKPLKLYEGPLPSCPPVLITAAAVSTPSEAPAARLDYCAPGRPPCASGAGTGGAVDEGRWVWRNLTCPVAAPLSVEEDEKEVCSHHAVPDDYTWEPARCALRPMTPAAMRACMSAERPLVIVGDSLSRNLAAELRFAMNPVRDVALVDAERVIQEDLQGPDLFMVVTYGLKPYLLTWDKAQLPGLVLIARFLTSGKAAVRAPAATLLFNNGLHDQRTIPLAHYADALVTAATLLEAWAGRIVWRETLAGRAMANCPLSESHARTRAFNHVAACHAGAHGWPVVGGSGALFDLVADRPFRTYDCHHLFPRATYPKLPSDFPPSLLYYATKVLFNAIC